MDTAGCIYSFGISFSFCARAGFTAFLFSPRGLTDTPSISIKCLQCIVRLFFLLVNELGDLCWCVFTQFHLKLHNLI
jgi:hypothetical protein